MTQITAVTLSQYIFFSLWWNIPFQVRSLVVHSYCWATNLHNEATQFGDCLLLSESWLIHWGKRLEELSTVPGKRNPLLPLLIWLLTHSIISCQPHSPAEFVFQKHWFHYVLLKSLPALLNTVQLLDSHTDLLNFILLAYLLLVLQFYPDWLSYCSTHIVLSPTYMAWLTPAFPICGLPPT